jgi:hypothetical protein
MATSSSRPSTATARLRSKTSELSDLFRGRQHSSVPSPSADSSSKPKRKIPLFGLRKKSPAARPGQRSPTLTPVPTPRPSTNAYVPRLAIFHANGSSLSVTRRAPHSPSEPKRARSPLPLLTIASTSFTPLPSFEDTSSKRSSTSPTNPRSARSTTRPSSSQTPHSLNKSRTPTPTSSALLGGSFSDSEPPRSASVRARTPTLLRSYASDDDERKYLSARVLPPAKPPPTTPLPPPPEDDSTDFGTPTTPGSINVYFPGQAGPYDAKSPTPSGRKIAMSTPRSPTHRFTSGSESASESAHGYTSAGYTSASGSESAATGLGLGFRIRTRSGQGSGNDSSFASRAASVRVGLLRTPNSLTGSGLSSSPAKSPAIPLSKSSPSVLPTSERTASPRPPPPSHSSAKRVSPPLQSALKLSETPGGKQPEPGTAGSSTKHASWLVVPKAAHTSPITVQDPKAIVSSHLTELCQH